MMGEPNSDIFTMYTGSEPISEKDGDPTQVKVGINAWNVSRSNPTVEEQYVLDNALCVPHDPFALIYATAVF
jgi:hypothetical protein